MPERRGSRFVVEALFLAALTVALALAHLDTLEIVGAMALGWLVVAAIEWAAWRGEPHYGAGLPPRYYLPRVDLPPPQPLEQVEQGYPDAGRDDAPTWIASASLRADVLGKWPVVAAAPPENQEAAEEEQPRPLFAPANEATDPWTAIALPPAPEESRAAPAAPSDPGLQRAPRPNSGTSWYTVDPFGDPLPGRPLRRGRGADDRWIRVPMLPRATSLPASHRNG